MAQPWYQLDWIWTATGWLLAILAFALFLWSLFADRARGRRRCPRCWYDMAGVPGLTCPECGRAHKSERRLTRTRRRRWTACLALLAILGGSAIILAPGIRRNGWRSILPTTVIIFMLPRAGADHQFDPVKLQWSTDGFAQEMAARVERGQVSSWQWSWALERTGVIRTRSRWPKDLPLRVGLYPAVWIAGSETTAEITTLNNAKVRQESGLSWDGTFEHYHRASEQFQAVGMLPSNTRDLRLHVIVDGGRSFGSIFSRKPQYHWSGPMTLHVRPVATPEEAITAVKGPSLDAAVKKALQVNVSTWNGSAGPTPERNLAIYIDRTKAPELRGIALGLTVDLLKNGTLLHTLKFDELTDDGFTGSTMRAIATPDAFHTNTLDPADVPHWTIRIRGDAEASLREFDCEKYWAGQIDYPLKDVLTR
jgi:hypothetical protein